MKQHNSVACVALAGLVFAVACAARTPEPVVGQKVACVATERTLSPSLIDSQLRPNIVQVSSESGLGSGFLLHTPSSDDVVIVTNYHVIAEGDAFEVTFRRGDGRHVRVGNVEVIKTSPEDDLALLKAPRMSAYGPGLSLKMNAKTGESVVTLGYPVLKGADAEPTLSNGLVTSTAHRFGGRQFILTDMPLVPGNSGGPAVDSCGGVLGVTSAFHSEATHVGMLVPADRIQHLYAGYLAKRAPAEHEIKVRLAKFVQLLEHDEGGRAASYFSREFYKERVFPVMKKYAEGAAEKSEKLQSLLLYLQRRGVDVNSLTEEELDNIRREFGLELTPAELMVVNTLSQAKRQGWDAYTTLQAYFAPLVSYIFGSVSGFKVQEVEGEDDQKRVFLGIEQVDGGVRFLEVAMKYEWGDWQIQSVRLARGNSTESNAPQQQSARERAGDWVPAKRSRLR